MPSVRHHDGQTQVREQIARDAAEQHVTQPQMAVRARDEQVGSGEASLLSERA